MDKDEAIEHLRAHRKKLEKSDVDSVWITQTASLVRDFLGDEVDEYTWIKNRKPPSWSLDYETNRSIKLKAKNEAIRFVNGCIDTIERNGLYKKPTPNFFYRFNNWQAISFTVGTLIVLISAAFIGGREWEKNISDTQNIELRQEVTNLKQQNEALQKENADLEQRINNQLIPTTP